MGVLREYPATLTSVFAVSALLLAAVGLFGMISYLVVQRTREIGIRMALGARPGDVMRLVMGRGLGPALAGIVAGLGAALALARVAESLLFGVSAADPVTFLLVPLVVIAVAMAATYLPARRAMRLDPMAAGDLGARRGDRQMRSPQSTAKSCEALHGLRAKTTEARAAD